MARIGAFVDAGRRRGNACGCLVSLALSLALFGLAGCEAEPPSRWESADRATREGGAATKAGEPAPVNTQALPEDRADVVAGGVFNKLFPEVAAPWDIVFKQEKEGFAQASLQKDGKETAVLSVSDTANNAGAAEKYRDAKDKIDGYPSLASGSLGTGILVDGRFQVQIRSAAEGGLSAEERAEWIKKFDLIGLEGLK